MTESEKTDWLGLQTEFIRPVNHLVAHRAKPTRISLCAFMNPQGDEPAKESTELGLWYDDQKLHIRVRCETSSMDRIRELVARSPEYHRDTWGDDAVEIQIDVGLTRETYLHFILPPTGKPVTYRGFNNRQLQGWHPDIDFRVRLEDSRWLIDADIPFSALGESPSAGTVWGFNLMRVNPSEPAGYGQWSPTFGDALRPELFGRLVFNGGSAAPASNEQELRESVEASSRYAEIAKARLNYFSAAINTIDGPDVLSSLNVSDWNEWSRHLANRETPLPLRWDANHPGADGIPSVDQPIAMSTADALVDSIVLLSSEPGELPSVIHKIEALGDAYLLTGDKSYVRTFEELIALFDQIMEPLLASTANFQHFARAESPYHDYQIIRAGLVAYAYTNMRKAGLSVETHAAVLKAMLRAGRFAAFNIRSSYNFGNHQLYESAGLAILALLFPEFDESDEWAFIASRSIRIHLERETLSDGGYMERCGYHCVALNYVMQAVTAIRTNGAESRFAELMKQSTLDILEQMHEWMLNMSTPGGDMPSFGDYGSHSQIRIFQRGAHFFARSDFAWPVAQWAPELICESVEPAAPDVFSTSLSESDFTIFRDGWERDSFYMAVDHGPLGGQHSHVDTMGFVVWAHGQPVAVDSGIGLTYGDPLYTTWYRKIRAHNVVVVDDIEPEKVAERTLWRTEPEMEFLKMRSRGYEHALGILHDRLIVFIKGVGWLIHDRLFHEDGASIDGHVTDWLLHTPFELTSSSSGILEGQRDGAGLLVLAVKPEEFEPPALAHTPASILPSEYSALRQTDFMRVHSDRLIQDVTELTWRKKPTAGSVEFTVFLHPFRGDRPDAQFGPTNDGWELVIDGVRTTIPEPPAQPG